MMKHGETKQSQQSPLLTPGAPGANTDGYVTAFFNIDRLPSSPGDEKSSTSAEQCRRAERRHQCLELRLDITGPGRGTADQLIEGPSGAEPFTGTFVPIMNSTNPSESSVAEPAKDVRSDDSVVSPGAGLSLSASVPTSGIAGIGPLTKPLQGPAVLGGPWTRDTKIPSKPVGSDAGDIASAVSAATGPGPASLMPTSRFADSHSLAVPFGGEAYQDGTSTRDTKIMAKPVGSDAGDIASAVSAATGPRPASLMPTSRELGLKRDEQSTPQHALQTPTLRAEPTYAARAPIL